MFSAASLARLETCEPSLVVLFREVARRRDCTIIEGRRATARQRELFRTGKSKLDGVKRKSRHQANALGLSEAVDAAPYPINWNTSDPANRRAWLDFARLVFAVADEMGISLRWGGDWNRNWDRLSDPMADSAQRFNDWPHWELAH